MKHNTLHLLIKTFIILLLAMSIISCAGENVTSGIIAKSDSVIPDGVPKRILIPPVTGDTRINFAVSEILSRELATLGFDIIPTEKFLEFLEENEIQTIEELSGDKLKSMINSLKIEGMITVHSGIYLGYRAKAFLDLNFIDLRNRAVIWQSRTGDTRWFKFKTDVDDTVRYTIDKTVNLLKKDLMKQKKRQQR